MHYNRYRYYDPEIGRFVSMDPIGLKETLINSAWRSSLTRPRAL
nr:RHS repeat-associated core domain-containing protein [Burkholderia multivorans]